VNTVSAVSAVHAQIAVAAPTDAAA